MQASLLLVHQVLKFLGWLWIFIFSTFQNFPYIVYSYDTVSWVNQEETEMTYIFTYKHSVIALCKSAILN